MEGTLQSGAESACPQAAALSGSDREREDWFVFATTKKRKD
jgi:hypothetical protein